MDSNSVSLVPVHRGLRCLGVLRPHRVVTRWGLSVVISTLWIRYRFFLGSIETMVWESDKTLSWHIGRRPLLDISIDRDPAHIKCISDFFNGFVILHDHLIRHFFFISLNYAILTLFVPLPFHYI